MGKVNFTGFNFRFLANTDSKATNPIIVDLIRISFCCAVLLLVPAACTFTPDGALNTDYSAKTATPYQDDAAPMTRLQLQYEVMRFTSRLTNSVQQGTLQIIAASDNNETRRAAVALEHDLVTNSIEIAIGTNPVVNLVDMVVFVTLARESLQNYWVPEVFGADGQDLLEAFVKMEKEIWIISGQLLAPEYQQELRDMIHNWQDEHPDQVLTNQVRLGSLTGLMADSYFKDIDNPSFLLPEVHTANQALHEMQHLSERILFYLQRVPYITSTEVEMSLQNSLAYPEIRQLLSDITRFTASAERISLLTEQLPVIVATERQALIDDLARESQKLGRLSSEIRQTLVVADDVADSINQAVLSFESLSRTLLSNPDKQPFIIKDYLATAKQMDLTAQQLNRLLNTLHTVTGQNNLAQRLQLFEQIYRSMLIRTFMFILAVLVTFFVLLLGYRLTTQRITGAI